MKYLFRKKKKKGPLKYLNAYLMCENGPFSTISVWILLFSKSDISNTTRVRFLYQMRPTYLFFCFFLFCFQWSIYICMLIILIGNLLKVMLDSWSWGVEGMIVLLEFLFLCLMDQIYKEWGFYKLINAPLKLN